MGDTFISFRNKKSSKQGPDVARAVGHLKDLCLFCKKNGTSLKGFKQGVARSGLQVV